MWGRRPGNGEIPAYEYKSILGKELLIDITPILSFLILTLNDMHLYVSGATGYLGTFLCRLMLSCKLPCTPISFFNPLNSNYIDNLDDLDSNSILLHLSDNSFLY